MNIPPITFSCHIKKIILNILLMFVFSCQILIQQTYQENNYWYSKFIILSILIDSLETYLLAIFFKNINSMIIK